MKLCNVGYCTCWFDTFIVWDFTPCCKLHDFNYKKQHISRAEADERFYKCSKKHSFTLLAFLMFSAVRVFGWYFWNKSKKRKAMSKRFSNAILAKSELIEHFKDKSNHYLYKYRDDNTIVANMCCDFEIIDGNKIERGGCGDAICYNLNDGDITIEKGM